ncbi:MAG: ATP-binding cassette domain-containing protein [Pseudomonadota bacterium]
MAEIMMRNLTKRWRSVDASFELSIPAFRLSAGEVVAVMGDNGTGKSTLLELLGLAAAPELESAESAFSIDPGDGRAVDALRLWRRRRAGRLSRLRARMFGYILQTPHLFPFLSIRANAELAQTIAGRRDAALIDRLIGDFGLKRHADLRSAELSIGLRQRAAIVRALATRPRFVLADEPTSALDEASAASAYEILLSLARDSETGVLLVSHDRKRVDAFKLRRVMTRIVERTEDQRLKAVLRQEAEP